MTQTQRTRRKRQTGSGTPSKLPKVVIGVAGMLALIIIVSAYTSQPRNYDAFAECLANRGFVMAGTSSCSYCTEQRALFKGSFDTVFVGHKAYIDCEQQPARCDELGVTGFPTWITPEGDHMRGMMKLSDLSRLSGCSLG